MIRKIIFFWLFKVVLFYAPELSGQPINYASEEYHWKVISNEYICSYDPDHKRHIILRKGNEIREFYCNDFRLSYLVKNQEGKYEKNAPYLFDLRVGKTLSEDTFQCLLRLQVRRERNKVIPLLEPFGQ